MGGGKAAEEGAGENGLVNGEEGEVGRRRGEIGGEGEKNGNLTGGLEVRGMDGREREARESRGEHGRREIMVGADRQKEEETGGLQIFTVVVEEALKMVGCLPGEALRGQDLLQGEIEGKGRGEEGRKGGGGMIGEGEGIMMTRMTICWRAATQSLPMMGMKKSGRKSSRVGEPRGRRKRRRGEDGDLPPTWTGITDRG